MKTCNEHVLGVQGRGRGTLEQGYDPPTLFSPVNFIAGITTNTNKKKAYNFIS